MGDLQIQHVPDEVLRALQARAARNNRSAEDEARALLTAAVSSDIRLGSLLTEIGDEVMLTDEEHAGFDRDPAPPREIDL
jgi:plasmid stability protein